MKKLILLMLIAISSINAFNQEVEADDVYIRGDGQLYFDGVPFNRDTVQKIADEAAQSVGFYQPNDSISLNPDVIIPEFPYTIVADSLTKKLAYYNSNGELRYFGAQADFPIINTTGSTIYPGTPLSAYGIDYSIGRGLPAIQVTSCTNYDLANSFAGVAEDTMLNGEIGNIVFRSLIIYNTSGFNIRDNLWVSVDSAITNVKPLPPNYPLYVGKVVTVGTSGIVAINAEPFTGNDTEVNSDGQLNGFTVYAPGVSDTVIGSNLYVEVNNSEDTTANLTYMYAGSSYDLPTTTNTGSYGRATIQLNYGTDTSLLYQYVYIDHNGGSPQLAVSTTGYPADGIRIVEFGVRSASKHSLYGMGFAHSENNAVDGSNANGVLTKIINRVKRDGSLINKNYPPDPTVSIITSAGKDTLKVTTTSGLGYQINEQVINAMNGPYVWWNSPNGTDSIIQSLSEINYAADGTSLLTNNSRYRLNIFVVIASEGYDCYLAVNVSDGIYATDDDCVNDIGAKSVVVPPSGMTEIVARFIALPIRYTTGNGGTIVNLLGDGNYQEEINFTFGTGGTGTIAGSGATYPVDDVTFSLSDNLDPTKIMQFDASNITTGTTRVLTIPDRSDTLMTALIDDSNPNLAGDLQTNGNNIVVESGDTLKVEGQTANGVAVLDANGAMFTSSGLTWDDSRLTVVSSGNNNMFIGEFTAVTGSGSNNVCLGTNAGYSIGSGIANTYTGYNAGLNKTTSYNSFFGSGAGGKVAGGQYNNFFGQESGYDVTGSYNVMMGARSGFNATGANNVFIGHNSGYNATGSGSVFLGYRAGYDEAGSNKLYIENSNSITPLIYGDFAEDTLVFNGKVNMSSHKITNLATPTVGTDAANKAYVDATSGGDTYKSTSSYVAEIPFTSPYLTLDRHTLTANTILQPNLEGFTRNYVTELEIKASGGYNVSVLGFDLDPASPYTTFDTAANVISTYIFTVRGNQPYYLIRDQYYVDTLAPTLAEVDTNDAIAGSVVLTYDEAFNPDSVPDKSVYTVTGTTSGSITIDSIDMVGVQVYVYTEGWIDEGVNISSSSAQNWQDLEGNLSDTLNNEIVISQGLGDVIFTNISPSLIVVGNDVEATVTALGNRASSTVAINATTGGEIRFQVGAAIVNGFMGLCDTQSPSSYTDQNYSISAEPSPGPHVVELGVTLNKWTTETFDANSILQIKIAPGGTVTYAISNDSGVTFDVWYTSLVTASGDYYFIAEPRTNGAEILNCLITQ